MLMTRVENRIHRLSYTQVFEQRTLTPQYVSSTDIVEPKNESRTTVINLYSYDAKQSQAILRQLPACYVFLWDHFNVKGTVCKSNTP